MKINALVMRAHGGPEVLTADTVEIPDKPAPGQVRIRVGAVGLNHLDLWFRRGMPHLKLPFPHRLGSDVAGTVEAIGEGAISPPVGAKVVLSPGVSCGVCEACQRGDDNMCREFRILGEFLPGGYGEIVDVPAANVFPVPAHLSLAEAASVPLVFLTAWALVVEKANVKLGDTVLVHAVGSGVSTAVVQIAKALGARIIGTTSTESKIAPARELGVEEVVHLGKQDFVAEVKRWTGKRGVDVVIDHVGGELFSNSIATLALGGRIVSCGATGGSVPSFDLTRVYMRYNSVLGTRMGARRFLFPILRAFDRKTFRPVIHRTLPMNVDGVREAHRVLEAREAFGKVVLAW
jgi:NADPH:quinone reductase-like Zn-dependent oxidoreductase